MSSLLWSFDELRRYLGSENPEVRFWAVDRLVRHFPEECCDAIAELLLDDHEATPTAVARHLAEHGAPRHHGILVRGFRVLRGSMPGYCLQALVRLGYPGSVELAASAMKRDDLNDAALATIIESVVDIGSQPAKELIRDVIQRRVELLAEPAALRGAMRVIEAERVSDVIAGFLQALRWRGTHRAGESFRTLMDALRIDDAGWCFRTGPSGHLELRKTIKAVESGYDCEIGGVIGETTVRQVAQRLRAGNHDEAVRLIAEWTRGATADFPGDERSDLAQRIGVVVSSFAAPATLEETAPFGQQFRQWLLGFQLSAAFAVARRLNPELALRRARGSLDDLLRLAELETAHLLEELPAAISAVCRDHEEHASRAQEWCLRMLETQGPFFPKVVALDVLGDLKAVHFVPEVMDYLSDENSYVYGAAERALSKMGEAIVGPAVERLEQGTLDPDAAHSVLVLFCDLGTQVAYDALLQHFDWFMESVGPGTTAEWAGLFGMEELIEPLRDWLEEDPPLVGQALLLLGAIHNVPIPEEEEILQAIEDERARQHAETSGQEGPQSGSDQDGGTYLM
jgi:HEAT repeat protein